MKTRWKEPTSQRFWPKVDIRGEDECWVWLAAVFQHGMHYGQFQMDGRPHNAHRVAWMLTNGPIPEGVRVLHHCDNPPCCNPAHLFLGSNSDNMRDMTNKGRGRLQRPFNVATGDRHGARLHPESRPRGERHPHTRLTDDAVREMRRLHREGARQVDLVAQFGIPKDVVSKIIRRQTWGHLSD